MKEKKKIDKNVLPIPMLGKEIDRMDCGSFYIAEHEHGILYHCYNSLDIIIRPGMGAFDLLQDLIRHKDELESATYKAEVGEDVETYGERLNAATYVLNTPLIAFTDIGYLYEYALKTVECITDMETRLINEAELQEETPELNREFEQATLAMDNIKEAILKDSKNS